MSTMIEAERLEADGNHPVRRVRAAGRQRDGRREATQHLRVEFTNLVCVVT